MATKDKEHKKNDGGTEADRPAGPPVPEVLLAGLEIPADTRLEQGSSAGSTEATGDGLTHGWVKDESGARKFLEKHEDVLSPAGKVFAGAETPGVRASGKFDGGQELAKAIITDVWGDTVNLSMVSELRAELIGEIGRVRDQLRSEMVSDRGLQLQMVGGAFNCPECGQRLNSPSLTGMKGGLYEHGFQSSPQLGGVQCKYKGRKFKPPVVFLEFADQPLTPKAE